VQDTENNARAFVKEYGLVFPSGLDPDMTVANAYKLIGLPLTVMISREGYIVDRITGPMPEKEFTERIERLL